VVNRIERDVVVVVVVVDRDDMGVVDIMDMGVVDMDDSGAVADLNENLLPTEIQNCRKKSCDSYDTV